MASSDRDPSRDRELVRHSHSFSSVPMWDSSDPERAPPPLPLNPGSPVLTTRPNTSAAIVNAAKALEEKARESLPMSSYTTNPLPQRSPERSSERSLIKGAQHKRMQSLQTTSVRDLKSFLDGVRSPERSPERPSTRSGTPSREPEKDYLSARHSPSQISTPTPSSRDILKDTPALRPTSRHLQKAILGENTPPSATMLALQTMTVPRELLDPPMPSTTTSTAKESQPPPQLEAISSQLLSITNIVSNLQKDMTQLSRRSKDNASDLISLKEATSARDEDIRKSLKELVSTMNQTANLVNTPGEFSRSTSSIGMKDPHMTPTKQFSMARMTSPSPFMMDERIGSPNPYSVEGAASVAMLEKIIREMVTKDGQERLIANLQTLVDKATGETAKKVAELAEFVKQGSQSSALVPAANSGIPSAQSAPGPKIISGDATSPFPLQKVSEGNKPYASPKAADFVSEEMLKFLRKIKDSVAESGCVTMGTKAMIQDLRGEVLGMGRELARKLEEVERSTIGGKSIESGQPNPDIAAVIQEGLQDLKQHMDEVMRERRRQSISSTLTRNTVDSHEVYDVVKHALAERGLDQHAAQPLPVDKEAIIAAVREANESYKPHIEVEQIGLERDEVLQCLREGFQEYRGSGSVTKEEIERTIQDAFQHVKFPEPINEVHEIREEVLMAVRECLEDIKPNFAQPQHQLDGAIRDVVLHAIKEGLADRNGPQEIELSQEVLYEAVKAALDASPLRLQGQSDDVVQHLHALVDDMHNEFKAYSSANGRDTEQVLDALKDGLDTLRSQIEAYIDKAHDDTQKDEVIQQLHGELERLRVDIQAYVAEGPRGDQAWPRGEMVAFIKSEFEHLHESLSQQLLPTTQDKEEILTALSAGFEGMKSQVVTRDLDLDTNDEINEAMKEEFDQLKQIILGDTASRKDEVIQALQAGFAEMSAKFGDGILVNTPNDDLLLSLKEEFEHLRETLGGTLVRANGSADKDDIIDGVRELMDGIVPQITSTHENASKANLSTILQELEGLRESLGSTLVRAEGSDDKNDILETIRSGLEDIKANAKSMDINEELLEAFRGELDQLRQSTGLTRQHARADTEEVLEAVRLGLDDLRSHLEKKLDNPERQMSATNEILDALNDGLEGLRNDVTKTINKPVDMTVSYEILDALKDGIATLREDIATLKSKTEPTPEEENTPTGNEVVLAEAPETIANRDIVANPVRRNDFEKMEVMLSQIQVKVEAMDANIQNPAHAQETAAPQSTPLADELTSIEQMLKDLQASVVQLQEREFAITLEGMATKEDTDAIETLLDNLKAKIEELNLPDPEKMVSKDNLDDIELIVRTTSESLEALSQKISEEGATKGDVAVVQVIVDDIKQALDEMKTAKPDEEEKITKTDVDDLAALVCDIKAKVDDMKIPDSDELPSKADVEQLIGLLHDFRESHDKLKETYEEDIMKTAKNFDDRKAEAQGLSDTITEVKVILDEVKDEIKAGLSEGGSIESLRESFKNLEDAVALNSGLSADVKDLMETVSREFERAQGSIEGLMNGQEEKSTLALEKQDEAKEAIIAEVATKLDERFDTLMTKYDDAQLLAEEQTKVMKEKAEEQEKILESTRAMADELRLTIDTLGASITGMNDRYEEATQKWATDYSAAVFGKIDDAVAKLEEQKMEEKTEHSHTRDEIANIERIFNGLQDNITEYHPKFMVILREIEALVKQHYDHAQKAKEAAEEQARLMNEEARARAEEVARHLNSLPALLPPPPAPVEAVEKYDDAQVQEKLDRLIGHISDAEKSGAHLERLDEIHKQVKATATEISEFVARQTQLVTDGNEAKEREAEGVALLLERRMAQKEQLEADIAELKAEKERVVRELKEEKERVLAEIKEEKERTVLELKEEKGALLSAVAALQAERENLANQKVRLTGEVSSLHTALEIRREELHLMDAKADALERRILNGIMDHSRALMMAKGTSKSPIKPKKRMSVDAIGDSAKTMAPPSTAANGLSLALKPRPAVRRNGPVQNPTRRILSLSQINPNTAAGAQEFPRMGNSMGNNANLKRSHSVKTNYLRKSSWNGKPMTAVVDKENEVLSEEDETEEKMNPVEPELKENLPVTDENNQEDSHSDAGTERRHNVAASSYAESYADGENPSLDGRSSYGGAGSEYTYASGSSYMTGSDMDRRTSYGSTAARSTLLDDNHTINEASEDDGSEEEDDEPTQTLAASEAPQSEAKGFEVTSSEVTASEVSTNLLPTQSEIEAAVEAVKEEMMRGYAAPSDSGVGTDLATAQLGHESEADYFRRAAEEESTVG
ncbi:uncharacterized protein EI97DRAFT_504367 [Westerdykella ornata]|uniref:Chromosome segregation ATPase family protein n=1 Tax=Westerdykella ornata TaxID=318751 RepID=A0A6A6J7L6_WESOR|nr:uncharacterized protein EI97DRAFT_504367 [Westerdykella ornata]KAF2272224.1 hypothetical protein EI97DRAFT_504367 [Westerdykella ornata]